MQVALAPHSSFANIRGFLRLSTPYTLLIEVLNSIDSPVRKCSTSIFNNYRSFSSLWAFEVGLIAKVSEMSF